MATQEQKSADEPSTEPASAGPKPSKKGIWLGSGALCMVALAWALSLVAVPKTAATAVQAMPGPLIWNVSPSGGFQTNLSGNGGQNYLVMNIAAEVEVLSEAYTTARSEEPLHQAKVSDVVLKITSRKLKSDLDDVIGKEMFREELQQALEPVLFPIHVGDESKVGGRHAASGLRPGRSIEASTLRGLFYEHAIAVNAAKKTLRLDDGEVTRFEGSETDLELTNARGESIFVDVSGITAGFEGDVHVGVFGSVRNVYFNSLLIQ